jgi:TPR repeat protein
MNRLLILPVLLLTLLVGNPAFSADYQKGLDAYQRGDYATALREWKPLAEQGNASAQYNLGLMYEKGLGTPQIYNTAVNWYRIAAEQGNALAQFNLGVMYEKGLGVPQNDKTAVKWYRLSAKQGDADAQYNLGLMYDKGQGVPQDYVRAHMWFNIAASSGDKDASQNRDIVAQRMTPSQIETAQKLARECVRKNYKGC